MSNTSFQEEPLLSRIHIHTNFTFFIVFLFTLCYNNLCGQVLLNENDKKIIYLSCLMDNVSLESNHLETLFDKFVTNANSSYSEFQIIFSPVLELHFYGKNDNPSDIYTIQLFKIPEDKGALYLLKFDSKKTKCRIQFFNTLWIRVSGYSLNDLKIFFDKLQERGLGINSIRSLVSSWCEADPLFKELDWNCLLDGYFRNDTSGDCYLSQKYVRIDALCVGCHNRIRGNNNSSFSKVILYGDIDFHL